MKLNRAVFFNKYKNSIDPDRKLSQSEVSALDLFLNFVDRDWCSFTLPQWAYIFATTFHETNATFLPVREAYWMSEWWRKANFRYYPYYGRGYVQITWKENYAYYEKLLGLPLVLNPDIAMQPVTAFVIMTHGFKNGTFTKKKIADYISDTKKDYEGARRCINGIDKAHLIANYARTFETILIAATK